MMRMNVTRTSGILIFILSVILSLNFALSLPVSSSKSKFAPKKLASGKRQNEEFANSNNLHPGESELPKSESMSLSDLLKSSLQPEELLPEKPPKVYKIELDPSFAVTTFNDPQKLGEVTSKAFDRFFKTLVRYLSVQMYDWSKQKD